jgi:hypothetical protein
MVIAMASDKPWAVDPDGNVESGPRPVRRITVKWGQVSAAIGGALFMAQSAVGGFSSERADFIRAGAILFGVALAYRALDIWETRRQP